MRVGKQKLARGDVRGLRGLELCARRILLRDLSGRTGLKATTNNLRLKLEGHKESFRA